MAKNRLLREAVFLCVHNTHAEKVSILEPINYSAHPDSPLGGRHLADPRSGVFPLTHMHHQPALRRDLGFPTRLHDLVAEQYDQVTTQGGR